MFIATEHVFHLQRDMPHVKAMVWDYYKVVDQDQQFARCLACNVRILRGGKTAKCFNMMNMIDHLQKKHPVEYKDYKEKKLKAVERTE